MQVPKLREARLSRGLRQRDLALAAGLSRQTVIAAEAGAEVTLETALRLQLVLDRKPELLKAEAVAV